MTKHFFFRSSLSSSSSITMLLGTIAQRLCCPLVLQHNARGRAPERAQPSTRSPWKLMELRHRADVATSSFSQQQQQRRRRRSCLFLRPCPPSQTKLLRRRPRRRRRLRRSLLRPPSSSPGPREKPGGARWPRWSPRVLGSAPASATVPRPRRSCSLRPLPLPLLPLPLPLPLRLPLPLLPLLLPLLLLPRSTSSTWTSRR